MKTYLYFSDGSGADASREAGTVCAQDLSSIVPVTAQTTALFFTRGEGVEDREKIVLTHDDVTASTGHRVREIARAFAQAANAGPHTSGVIDFVDLDNSVFFGDLSFVTGVDIKLQNAAG